MDALKICSLARDVPDPELTVTSQGTGNIIRRASSSINGRPNMVFFGLLAMFESKCVKSVIVCCPDFEQCEVTAAVRIIKSLKTFRPEAEGPKLKTNL
jgi:hypothetical protein